MNSLICLLIDGLIVVIGWIMKCVFSVEGRGWIFQEEKWMGGGGVFLVMARAILESLSIEKHGVESWAFEN
jgi:hypothetical protein